MRKSLLLLTAAFMSFGAQAKVRLHHLVSDNMVLQCSSEARLWGWDTPGKTVRVSTSWSKDVVTARAAKDGSWEVRVRTPKPSFTPLTITFDDGEQTTIKGVLSGEVWVCAGQSNMEMPVHGFDGCPVEGYNDAVIDAANFSGVRYAKIPSRMSMSPEQDADTRWTVVSPSTVRGASATGYFFGRLLSKSLGVPVGLIEANKGGTRVESWLSQENLKANTDEKLDKQSIDAIKTDYYRPLVWGNGTFSPIEKYTVKVGCSKSL